MRDLVETVINGLLQQEKMQQHAANQKKLRASIKAPLARNVDQASLHSTGPQMPALNNNKDPALWKVSTQFEAIFVQQMMSEMRKTVDKSDLIPTGFAEDVHGSMMDEAIAQASVKHHSFGLADSIYRQLERTQSDSKQTGLNQPGLNQLGSKQSESIQAIAASADKLQIQMKNSVNLEVNRHAH